MAKNVCQLNLHSTLSKSARSNFFWLEGHFTKPWQLAATSNIMMYQSCKRASFWSPNPTRARNPETDPNPTFIFLTLFRLESQIYRASQDLCYLVVYQILIGNWRENTVLPRGLVLSVDRIWLWFKKRVLVFFGGFWVFLTFFLNWLILLNFRHFLPFFSDFVSFVGILFHLWMLNNRNRVCARIGTSILLYY